MTGGFDRHDGPVVVGDLGHKAYQLFDPTGEFLRMVRMGRTETSRRVGDVTVTLQAVRAIQPDPQGGAVYTLEDAETADSTAREESAPAFRTIAQHRLDREDVGTSNRRPRVASTARGREEQRHRSGRRTATKMPDAFGPYSLAAFIELDEYDVASVVVRRVGPP